jgi:hypothetical protein
MPTMLPDGAFVDATTTGPGGFYIFDSLKAGKLYSRCCNS